MQKRLTIPLIMLVVSYFSCSVALRLPLPAPNQDVVGVLHTAVTTKNTPFPSIARQHDVGFFELLEANPSIDPEKIIPGTLVIVPTRFILPPVKRSGIVINLGTMRLYYFPKNKDYFYTYPIGIGKENWETPLGQLSIIQKIKNPSWIVPKSIYEFRKKAGDPVPKVVKPGKDNPLGMYALRLSLPTYLIHDTNDPASVGVRSSAGCIHLYHEDIEELFNNVDTKENVVIINQPYLLGWDHDALLLEAHLPLLEVRDKYAHVNADLKQMSEASKQQGLVMHPQEAATIVADRTGVPVQIGHSTHYKPTLSFEP